MAYHCEFCGHDFTRAYTLLQHQKKTKYCLGLQQQKKRQQQKNKPRKVDNSDRMQEKLDQLENRILELYIKQQENKIADMERQMAIQTMLITKLVQSHNHK